MSSWRQRCVDEIRERLVPEDEGSLWVLFFAGREQAPVAALAVGGDRGPVDEAALDGLVSVVLAVPAKAVLFAVPRASGQPRTTDLLLWHGLRDRLVGGPGELIDLLVIGSSDVWSARGASARQGGG